MRGCSGGKGALKFQHSPRQWHHCLPGLADDNTRERFSLNVCVCVCVCVCVSPCLALRKKFLRKPTDRPLLWRDGSSPGGFQKEASVQRAG